jgi:hypothetical protein
MKTFDELTGRARERPEENHVVKSTFKVTKANDDKMMAFGWASVAIDVEGNQVIDWQEDMLDPEVLEEAAYSFVRFYREGWEMHERGGVATLIESVVFTEEKQKAMGIPAGTLPVGWWIGFLVTDQDVWEKVKDGTYSMFSIEGTAERVEVPDPDGPEDPGE